MIQKYEDTGVMPPNLENRVELPLRWKYAHSIFELLDGSRRPAFEGKSEIPFSEFWMYADMHEFPKPLARELWREVHLLDLLYLDVVHGIAKEKRAQSKTNKSTKKPSR